jgi:hypothetical protein
MASITGQSVTDPAALLIDLIDRSFMALYFETRKNANRLARLALALLPLMLLLVGSCKISALPASYAGASVVEQFRAALFPDHTAAADYVPARGYIARAQKFVESDPDSLLKLTEDEVSYIFGRPSMERRDADAHIWQYKSNACVVDVYFYEQPGMTHGYNVAHVDFRMKEQLVPGIAVNDEAPSARRQSECLRKLARQGAAPVEVARAN